MASVVVHEVFSFCLSAVKKLSNTTYIHYVAVSLYYWSFCQWVPHSDTCQSAMVWMVYTTSYASDSIVFFHVFKYVITCLGKFVIDNILVFLCADGYS